MNDPDKIDRIIDLLKIAWKLHPDWRIGEVFCELSRNVGFYDPYFVSDDRIEKALSWIIEDAERSKGS